MQRFWITLLHSGPHHSCNRLTIPVAKTMSHPYIMVTISTTIEISSWQTMSHTCLWQNYAARGWLRLKLQRSWNLFLQRDIDSNHCVANSKSAKSLWDKRGGQGKEVSKADGACNLALHNAYSFPASYMCHAFEVTWRHAPHLPSVLTPLYGHPMVGNGNASPGQR